MFYELEDVPRLDHHRVEYVEYVHSCVPRNNAWTPQQAIELGKLMGLGRHGDMDGHDQGYDAGRALAFIMTACGVTSEEDILGCLDCLLEFKTADEVLHVAVWFRACVANPHHRESSMSLRAG